MAGFFIEWSTIVASAVNYSYILFALIVLFFSKSQILGPYKIYRLIFSTIVIFQIIYNDHNDYKNIVNQISFLAASTIIVSYIYKSEERKFLLLNNVRNLVFTLTIFVFSLLIINTANFDISNLSNSYNTMYNKISAIYLHKQGLGELYMIFTSFVLASSRFNKWHILLFISFPLLIGIRTYMLSWFFLGIFFFFRRTFLVKFYPYIYLLLPFMVFFIINIPPNYFVDVRIIYWVETLNIIQDHPFGIGLFGFDEFLKDVYNINPATFSEQNNLSGEFTIIDRAITTLESDFLNLVVSTGIFGLIIYALYAYVIVLNLSNYSYVTYPQKVMILITSSYHFAGFTEDFAFSVKWWILHLLAVAFLRHEIKKNSKRKEMFI
jgi:hypothetical protein